MSQGSTPQHWPNRPIGKLLEVEEEREAQLKRINEKRLELAEEVIIGPSTPEEKHRFADMVDLLGEEWLNKFENPKFQEATSTIARLRILNTMLNLHDIFERCKDDVSFFVDAKEGALDQAEIEVTRKDGSKYIIPLDHYLKVPKEDAESAKAKTEAKEEAKLAEEEEHEKTAERRARFTDAILNANGSIEMQLAIEEVWPDIGSGVRSMIEDHFHLMQKHMKGEPVDPEVLAESQKEALEYLSTMTDSMKESTGYTQKQIDDANRAKADLLYLLQLDE